MSIITLILIIFVIILFTNNKHYKKELENYKSMVKSRKNFCPKCGYDLYGIKKSTADNLNNTVIQEKVADIKYTPKKKEKKLSDKEIKNSLILVVGSILIILAAILFLTTTWEFTHNILKTFTIVLMLLVFLAASYIGKKYFHLEHTSLAFYYLALAYLPIILISIALFELFGKYLSIYGLGKYIYFTVSGTIITFIYYKQAIRKNSVVIGYASIIFSFLSVMSFVAIFSSNTSIIILGVVLYFILLEILYVHKLFYVKDSIHKLILSILVIALSVVVFYNNFYNIFDIFIDVALFFGISYYFEYISIRPDIYKFVYPILIFLIFLNIALMVKIYLYKQIVMIIALFIIYFYDLIRYKNINIVSYILSIICTFLLFADASIYYYADNNVINTCFISIVATILSFINYIYNKGQKFSAYSFSPIFILSAANFITTYNLSSMYLILISYFMVVVSSFVKDINMKNSMQLFGNICFILTSIINFDNLKIMPIIYVLYIALCAIFSVRESKKTYRIIAYCYFTLLIMSILNLYNVTDYIYYIRVIPISTICIFFYELLNKYLVDEVNKIYILINLILSIIFLVCIKATFFDLFLIIFINSIFILYIYMRNMNKKLLYIPILSMIPYIYIMNLFKTNTIILVISTLSIILLLYLLYKSKNNMYLVLYYVYLFAHLCYVDCSSYFNLFLASCGAVIGYMIKGNKVKDVFKAILYTNGLILYNMIVYDMGLNSISVFRYIGYMIWLVLLTRLIIKKYTTDYKVLEYIGYVIINLVSLANYASETDGIIFVFLLTLFVIGSYMFKFGPIFITCISFILVNVFWLTRVFWLSIPWWIYILLVGAILIAFAIYNELNDNKYHGITNKIKKELDL